MPVCVFIKPTYPTSDVTTIAESAVYILHIFANNFGIKRDSLVNGQSAYFFMLFHMKQLLPVSFK